jgi:hypothetical protein
MGDLNNFNGNFMDLLALSEEVKQAKTEEDDTEVGILKKRLLEEGEYSGVITNAKLDVKDTIYGEQDCVELEVRIAGTKKTLRKILWYADNSDSEYIKTLYNLLGKNPLTGFRMSELKGIICRIEIVHKESKNGKTHENIELIDKLDINTNEMKI